MNKSAPLFECMPEIPGAINANISLRLYIATQILSGTLGTGKSTMIHLHTDSEKQFLSEQAIKYADALIKADQEGSGE